MTINFNQWHLVIGSKGVPDYGGDLCHSGAKGAKNIQGNEPCHDLLLNLCTYNIQTLRKEADVSALMETLLHIQWDVVRMFQ